MYYIYIINFRKIPEFIYRFHGGGGLISILSSTSRFTIHQISTEKQVMSFIMKGARQRPIYNYRLSPLGPNLLKIYHSTSNTTVLAM